MSLKIVMSGQKRSSTDDLQSLLAQFAWRFGRLEGTQGLAKVLFGPNPQADSVDVKGLLNVDSLVTIGFIHGSLLNTNLCPAHVKQWTVVVRLHDLRQRQAF